MSQHELVLLGVTQDKDLVSTYDGSGEPPVKTVLVYLNRLGEKPRIHYRGTSELLTSFEQVRGYIDKTRQEGDIPLALTPDTDDHKQAQAAANQEGKTNSLISNWIANPNSRGF